MDFKKEIIQIRAFEYIQIYLHFKDKYSFQKFC